MGKRLLNWPAGAISLESIARRNWVPRTRYRAPEDDGFWFGKASNTSRATAHRPSSSGRASRAIRGTQFTFVIPGEREARGKGTNFLAPVVSPSLLSRPDRLLVVLETQPV